MRIRSPGPLMITFVVMPLSLVVALVSTSAADAGDAAGKLTGDGQEISWSLGGAKVGSFDAGRRAEGTLTGHTVTFSGVMREWVPKGFATDAVLTASIAIPGGKRREAVWKGELSGAAGLSHELPFDLTLDIPANTYVFVGVSVTKIGGVADTLGAEFKLAPAPAAATSAVVATPQPGPTQQPTPSMSPVLQSTPPIESWWTHIRAIESLAAVVAGLLTALGALLTASLSGFDVEDVLKALRDVIKGGPAADGDQDESAKGKEARQLSDLATALQKAAQQLKAEGKYVANGSLIDKVWYGVPRGFKAAVGWLADVLPTPTEDPNPEATRAAIEWALGRSAGKPPRPELDPNWGQCGEAAEWGARMMEGPIHKIFGPDAIFTKITLQSNLNPLGNHIANKVIAPNGERYVVDMWATMVEGEPKIYTEEEWLATWKSKPWICDSVTVSRGELNSSQESDFEEAVQNYGLERGIKAFRLEYKTHPAQAETIINSYRKHPWRIELADQTDAAHPASAGLPNLPSGPEKTWRGKLK